MAKKGSKNPPVGEYTDIPPFSKIENGGKEEAAYFTQKSWRGVKLVFKCVRCGTFRDTRDAMVEHVLLHFPRGEQELVFNQLVKEQ